MPTNDEKTDPDKAARKAQYEALGSLETSGERLKRRSLGILILVVCLLSIVGAWSAGWRFTSMSGGSAESEVWGTAKTRSCEPNGPITLYGVGYWWTCTADVSWNGQSSQTLTFKGSELTPADIGKQVRVTSVQLKEAHDTRGAEPYRDTTRPFWFMNVVMWVFIAVLVGVAGASGIPRAFFPLSEWFEIDKDKAAKYWTKYEREGRLPPELARQTPPRVEPESDFPPPQTGQR